MSKAAVLMVGFVLLASKAYATTAVDTKTFVKRIEGAYVIELAGGEVPKAENTLADVFVDADEGVLTLPYCSSSGICDPGFVFLPYASTTVLEESLPGGGTVSRITVDDGGRKVSYSWTQTGDKYTFDNPDYVLDGKSFPLQHRLIRK